jgi:predicted nucleic-acid-binding Zn-ribbon protein
MSLTQDEIGKLQSWLNAKSVSPNCPACGQNKWTVGDVIAAPVFGGGGFNIGGPTVPMVQVICGNCAYVRLFAAVPIGIVK